MTNKLCKDCKFSMHDPVYGSKFFSSPGCARPDPYTGFPVGTSLDDEREGYGVFKAFGCGPKGKYFEPKETEAGKVRTFNEYYNAYCDEVRGAGGIGATEKAVRAVLDLAKVEYTD
jgi:hypothetical protein